MNIKLHIIQSQDGTNCIKLPEGVTMRICSVNDTIKSLHKTRRQIYRYIENDTLLTYGKFFGEWLIDLESVTVLKILPMKTQPIPKKFQSFFPEYNITDLNAGKDRVIVISRILDYGGARDLKWLKKRYSVNDIKNFIKYDGSRLLSRRSLNFWSIYYNVSPKLPQFRKGSSWSLKNDKIS